MVIFHSYVSLPEGIMRLDCLSGLGAFLLWQSLTLFTGSMPTSGGFLHGVPEF